MGELGSLAGNMGKMEEAIAAGQRRPSKFIVQVGWEEVPHLSADAKAELLAGIPAFQRDARTKGIPQLGAGAIYTIPVADISIPDLKVIPPHWRRVYGLDVGWNWTAAVWGAWDETQDIVYLYNCYKRGRAEPVLHSQAIKARGEWIPGVIDPAAQGRLQDDGRKMIELYRGCGLNIEPADHTIETGIFEMWNRLTTARLKVFASMAEWFAEYSLYRRNDKGTIVKDNDHLMDACLAGHTLVSTNYGKVSIQFLVGREGWVRSRSGAWCRFFGARRTIQNAAVVRLAFDDGQEVVCTPNHLFLTPSGWVEARYMTGVDCYNGVSQCIQFSQWWSRWCLRPFRSLTVGVTTCAASISSVMASACTVWCGVPCMAFQCQMATMFTTRTPFAQTISRTIWNSFRNRFTFRFTSAAIVGPFLSRHMTRLVSGTDQRKDESGTERITRSLLPRFIKWGRSCATTAINRLRPSSQARTDSVRTPARPTLAKRLVWTTLNALAWSAAACFWSIATFGNKPAQARARQRCCSVTAEPRLQDVYCLTVPAISSFAIADGLIVHNSRYLLMSGLSRAITEPAPLPPPELVYSMGGVDNELGWMG